MPTALVKNLAGSWVGPSSKVSTLALNLPSTLASPEWANVSFPLAGTRHAYLPGHLGALHMLSCSFL